MMDDPREDAALEALFQAERTRAPEISPEFMARLEAEAVAAIPKPAPQIRSAPRRTSWLAGIFTASGLSGAALAGIWIGFAMPESFDTLTLTADNSVSLTAFLPGADMGSLFDE
ncbi:hypothetical protein N9L47_01420 [Rhodobacteraceae bacterium]|nr:hypothetical protein [Paracoccaceae bacterium]